MKDIENRLRALEKVITTDDELDYVAYRLKCVRDMAESGEPPGPDGIHRVSVMDYDEWAKARRMT